MTMISAQAIVQADKIDSWLPSLLSHMEEHATVNFTDEGAIIASPFGTVQLCRQADGLSVAVRSASVEILAMIKVFIAEHVFEFAGETASIVWSGDTAPTRYPAHFHRLIVTDLFDVTPRMRRITFSCERAAAFADGAGYHVRLLLPPDRSNPIWPSMGAGGRLTWPGGKDALVNRVYTIRDVDVSAGQVEIDFVLHDVPGPAAKWAANARRGDPVGILGPSGGRVEPADRYLIVGDETALPAISRILGDLPAASRGVAFIEVQNKPEIQQISGPADLEIRWLLRESAPPGTTSLLQDAVMTFLEPSGQETCFAWISCEFTACNAIRTYLREMWQAPKGSYLATSYWRRGACEERANEEDFRHDQ